MSNTFRILRSTTAGNTPASLVSGQIAVNEADGRIFYRAASGTVTTFSSIASYATSASFPATGASSSVLYLASDTSRLHQFVGGVYVEIGTAGVGATHASTHATGGSDAITPASIGAAAASHVHSADAITSGTLDDARLSGNVTRNENLRWAMQANTNSIDWMPRGHGSFGNAAATSGGLTLVFFTAPYSFTATTLTFCTGGTPTSGLSLCRFGLFTVSETITDSVTATSPVVTLVARTANDTTIGNIANTLYSRTFVADGLPESYALVGGTRYAAGLLVVGTTPGTWMSANLSSGAVMRLPPMVAGFVGSLTDLPTSPQTVSSGTFALYGRIS